MVNQQFLDLRIHPEDGLLEIKELTTIFTNLNTDGIWLMATGV